MKTLVLGCNGQLGRALADTRPDGVEFTGLDLPELDITDVAAVLEVFRESKPAVIINAAAYTAVDQAESQVELAMAVNMNGPRNIAVAANKIGARLIHISTDFVFDGRSSSPYMPGDRTNPLNVYGRSKQAGEQAVLEAMPRAAVVVRTAWLYSKTGGNFVKTMLRLMGERDQLGVVADQFGTPTWADSLATAVWGFSVAPELCGIYHWTDGGSASWHEFAVAIQEEALSVGLLKKTIPILAISTAEYATAAERPRYSVLDCSTSREALNLHPSHWRGNLQLMLQGLIA